MHIARDHNEACPPGLETTAMPSPDAEGLGGFTGALLRGAESTEGCSEARSKAEGARASEYSIRANGPAALDVI